MALVKRLLEQWDRSLSLVLLLVGLVALILGYEGVSRTEFVAAQIPYFISGGLFGLFLLGTAGVLWLSSDLRDDWVKLQQIEERLDEIQSAIEQGRVPSASTDSTPAGSAPRSPARTRSVTAPPASPRPVQEAAPPAGGDERPRRRRARTPT
jgi:uncharacterized membrane protein YtjA (UPF0391 family)